jgi:hypothetical protein
MSLILQPMIAAINLRLQQAKANHKKPFGGVSVIIAGNPGHLLLACAPALYDDRQSNLTNLGKEVYFKFKL